MTNNITPPPQVCLCCGSSRLNQIETCFPQSMRSDGLIFKAPLIKFQCMNCGAGIGHCISSASAYLRSTGNSQSEIHRHKGIAQGIHEIVESFELENRINLRVLEIGAASFSASLELKRLRNDWHITALEPNPENGEDIGQINEIECVTEGFEEFKPATKYDICFSNHVIEHIPNPVIFLKHCKAILNDEGFVIVCCPNSASPHLELLFADHLWHFTLMSLRRLCAQVGLMVMKNFVAPWDSETQVFVLTNHIGESEKPTVGSKILLQDLFEIRKDYFNLWATLDRSVSERIGNDSILLFGAGEYSQLIATYLPITYSRVERIVVDDLNGIRAFDKPIERFSLETTRGKKIILGIHKRSRNVVFQKIKMLGLSESDIFTTDPV